MVLSLLVLTIWIALVSPGQGRQPSSSFLVINEQNEILLLSRTESTFTVQSRYADVEESKSYIVVSVEDQEIVQVVNITRIAPNVTRFVVRVTAQGTGETTCKVQLWDSNGNRHRLIEETGDLRVKVVNGYPPKPLSQPPGYFTSVVVVLILPLILLNKCAFGCKIELETLRSLWRKPLPMVLGATVQFVFMPLWGFLLTRMMQLPQALSLGFVLTCTCPGGGGGYLYALLLEGDITLAISMTCSLTMLSLVMMPLNAFVYGRGLGLTASLHIPFLKMMVTLLSIATPISVGIIVKRRTPICAQYLERVIRPLTFLIVVLGIYLGFQVGSQFLAGVHADVLLIALLIPAFGLLLGYCFSARLFKLPFPICKTVAIESGVQNSFLALAIIQLSFPEAEANVMSVAPFLVALGAAGEMLLVVLLYNARKKSVRLE
ncbi:sodium/bile acid cotransporter 5 [Ambystoma mexicanum]|uniref:sodium/bile acid cotransporter 5 n=1 Tax=Ambystoma mexicanum TaxID=8296 RepID=UPI0037E824B9